MWLFFLQVRTLIELCLFTEAITEIVQLTQGTDVILPSGHVVNTNPQVHVFIFYTSTAFLTLDLCLEMCVFVYVSNFQSDMFVHDFRFRKWFIPAHTALDCTQNWVYMGPKFNWYCAFKTACEDFPQQPASSG